MAGSIVGAVAGGLINKAFGGGGGSSPSQTAYGAPDWIIQQLDNLYRDYYKNLTRERASGAAATPYGRSPDIRNAYSAVRSGIFGQQNLFPEAANYLRQGVSTALTPVDFSQIQPLMNPYQQGVVDIAKRNAIQDYDNTIVPQLRDAAVAAGAFGGTRQGLVESQAQRNLADRLTNIQTQGSQQAYDNAVDLLLKSRGQSMQAGLGAAQNLANLAGAGQNYLLSGAGALEGIGRQQVSDVQTLERPEPELIGLLGQITNAMKPQVQFGPPQPSGAQQMIGGALTGAGLGNQISDWWSSVNTANSTYGPFQPGASPWTGFSLPFKEGGLVKSKGVKKYESGGLVSMLPLPPIKKPLPDRLRQYAQEINKSVEAGKITEQEAKGLLKAAIDKIEKMNSAFAQAVNAGSQSRFSTEQLPPVKKPLPDRLGQPATELPSELPRASNPNPEAIPELMDIFNTLSPSEQPSAVNQDVAPTLGNQSFALPTLSSMNMIPENMLGTVPPQEQPEPETEMPSPIVDLIRKLEQQVEKRNQPREKTFTDKLAEDPLFRMGVAMLASSSPNLGGALGDAGKEIAKMSAEKEQREDKESKRGLEDILTLFEAQKTKENLDLQRMAKEAYKKQVDAMYQTKGNLTPKQKMDLAVKIAAERNKALRSTPAIPGVEIPTISPFDILREMGDEETIRVYFPNATGGETPSSTEGREVVKIKAIRRE